MFEIVLHGKVFLRCVNNLLSDTVSNFQLRRRNKAFNSFRFSPTEILLLIVSFHKKSLKAF